MSRRAKRSTGRRPNRSDRLPTVGPHKNCMTAKAVASIPPHTAASPSVPPPTSIKRSGITGTMIPIPIASMATVQRMKNSGRRLFILRGTPLRPEGHGLMRLWLERFKFRQRLLSGIRAAACAKRFHRCGDESRPIAPSGIFRRQRT